MDVEDKKFLLGLKLIPCFNRQLTRVLEVFGSPKRAWNASSKELMEKLGASAELCEKVFSERNKIDIDLEFKKLVSSGAEIISEGSSSYPKLLREIDSPPILLSKGDKIKSYTCAVAIVGSRKASVYGRELAFELAQQLSELGVTVVSGVARGIDSGAHRGALLGKGGTIGVLGCGLDLVYPPENRKLYSEIAEKGSLISEYPLGTLPFPQNFPARNRIISGLSKGVIVVEASEKSGALITADFALEQGREVMVVPGNVKSLVSRGCHKLIKQGAYLIETVDDVADILNLDLIMPQETRSAKCELKVELSADEQKILDYLGWEPKHIDQILQAVDFDISRVSTLLTVLELKRLVKRDFGHNYVRIQ